MSGSDEQRAILDSELYWFGQLRDSNCHGLRRTHAKVYDDPYLGTDNSPELSEIEDGYQVSLDLKTGEIAVRQIVDGVVIDNADN